MLVLGTLLPRLVQAREDGLWARGTAMKELSTGRFEVYFEVELTRLADSLYGSRVKEMRTIGNK